MDEFIDVVDSNGTYLGKTILKTKAHEQGVWHTSVDIWIYNSDQEVLIQKRAANKDTHPDCWDVSVAGHITAGESPVIAAQRELQEELGLGVNISDLQFVKTFQIEYFHRDNFIDREFHYVYVMKYEPLTKSIKLQTEEVADVKWIKIHELNAFIDSKKKLVPYPKAYIELVIERIKAST